MAFFDDLTPPKETPMATTDRAEHTSPTVYVPAPCDNNRREGRMPAVVPVSPCASEESTALARVPVVRATTGRPNDIEDRYRVDPRVLGAGRHGSVRECVDRATGRRRAVKSVRKDDPEVGPAGLAREVALLRGMRHRNVVSLVDAFEDDAHVHLVTDLCAGGELFDRIVARSSVGRRDRGRGDGGGPPCFAEADAARIMRQVLAALSYLHGRDVVHRDVKPENILFETTDERSPIRIVDFGLARKHSGTRGEPPMTSRVGTPYYVAPEVLRGRYDRSCDLWSAGVVAYVMLCGYPPFDGANNAEVYEAVRRGRCSFPSPEWSGTSEASRDFICRLLQRDPRKRLTAEQALEHPWILKHTVTDAVVIEDVREDKLPVEVAFKGLLRDSIICGCMEAARMLTFSDL